MTQAGNHVDLTACDREPIHIPGSIQPHGMLFVVETEGLEILQAAGDSKRFLGRSIDGVLNQDIRVSLGPDAASLIDFARTKVLAESLYLGSIPASACAGQQLDLTAHPRDGAVILEVEPSSTHSEGAAQILSRLRSATEELGAAPDLNRLLQAAARLVRRLTGFDRVMIYRFLEGGTGSVVAEDKAADLPPFLNHHYPASDIPKQARALYLKNVIRVIPNVNYTPAPLVPARNPLIGDPLDLSDCMLRSVSPIHVQYLKNMEVAASMSVSIVVDGSLWGLIACHHREPRFVPYERREICRHIGHSLSHELRARDDDDHKRQLLRLAASREQWLAKLSDSAVIEQYLLDHVSDVKVCIPAHGAAVLIGSDVSGIQSVPAESQIRDLAAWLLRTSPSDCYETDRLSDHYDAALDYSSHCSGLLAIVVSREEPLVLFWFRAEQIETINWAGNPHKAVETDEELGTLNPRRSFEAWKETVRNRSRPWSAAEVDAARKLGQRLSNHIQRQNLRKLNRQLRRTLSEKETLLAQKDLLMKEVDHRVQNSLQLVGSMLYLYARESSDIRVKTYFEEAIERITAISTVHKHLWISDSVHTVDFGPYMDELRTGLIEVWGGAWRNHIKVKEAHVHIPTTTAVILALVVTELLTNAVKYAYEGKQGPIEVTVECEGRDHVMVTVEDQGVGIGKEPHSGFGSRLTRTLLEQLKGKVQVTSKPTGTSVSLTVPLSQPV